MRVQPYRQMRRYHNTAQQQVLNSGLAAIERLLERLYGERMALVSPASGAPYSDSPSNTKSGRSTDQATKVISDLDLSIERLENIKKWLTEDRQLLALVDDAISQHMQQMERRTHRLNVQLAVATTIGGAVLGWLLAAVSAPQDLLRLLGH